MTPSADGNSHHPWLIFRLDEELFGVDARHVRETVWLPELEPVEEAPYWVVGLFTLRGQIIPVTDLGLRFGHPQRRYQASDQVLVVELGQYPMGLVVSEVSEVMEIADNRIQPPPQFNPNTPTRAHLIQGEVHLDHAIVALLSAEQLLHPTEEPGWRDHHPVVGPFCADATAEERELFRQRADVLRQAVSGGEESHLALAVVELDGSYFGIELEAVREFCKLGQWSPIPCCPPHVLGAISLRGTLLTLLDLSAALNLSASKRQGGKVVVASLGRQLVGMAVDEVHDVFYPRQGELQVAPMQLRQRHGAEIKGATAWNGRMMPVLDLHALLARDEWIVNEPINRR